MNRRTLFKSLLVIGFGLTPKAAAEPVLREIPIKAYDLTDKTIRITMLASEYSVGGGWSNLNVDETWEFKRDADGVCGAKRI